MRACAMSCSTARLREAQIVIESSGHSQMLKGAFRHRRRSARFARSQSASFARVKPSERMWLKGAFRHRRRSARFARSQSASFARVKPSERMCVNLSCGALRASGQQPVSAPLSTRCRAVRFHVRGVDHLRVGGSSVPSKLPEQVFPDAAPRPAHNTRTIPVPPSKNESEL